MKNLLIVLILGLFVAGCTTASDYLGSTEASYENTALGPKLLYKSNKNQQNFRAQIELDPDTGKPTGLNVETTATTPESAIAATQQANMELIGLLKEALSAAAAANKGGGLPNVPVNPNPNPAPRLQRDKPVKPNPQPLEPR